MENTSPNETNISSVTASSQTKLIGGVVAIAVIVVLVAGAFFFKDGMLLKSTNQSTQTNEKNGATATTHLYKDGTYDVVGEYLSPGGPEQIQVQLTLKDNIITDAEVVSIAERPQTKQFQGMFVENYKPMVIGKNIDELQLTKVSGSSLTPKGFNDALEKIKAEAQV